MPDSPVISGVADLPKFYFAEGAPFRLTLTIGAEFSMTGKFVTFGMRARSGTVRRVFGTDSGESNLTIAGQVITLDIATSAATVPAFASGWTLENVQTKGETEYWVDISATEGSDVLLRLQGQADWVAPGSDIAESSAVVASPSIDVAITSGAVSASVAVLGAADPTLTTNTVTSGLSGILKAASNTLEVATAGTDYVAANASASLKDLALNPDALTGSLATSALNITQTWNTTGNPTLLKGYVTNSASGANAKLLDLGAGSTTRLNLDLSGHLYTNATDDYAAYGFLNSSRGIGYSSANEKMLMYVNSAGTVNAGVDANGLFLPQTGNLSWSSSGWASASDLFMSRAAAATLQLGVNNATTATRQIIKGHNVTTGNNTGAELNFRAGNGANGVPGTRGVWFGDTSSSSMKIFDSLAGVVLGGYYNEGLRGYLRLGGGSGGDVDLVSSSADGNITLTPNGTGKVKFGAFTALTSHTASGYIEIRDAGGTLRRLAVIA